jgi:hypothetical protein
MSTFKQQLVLHKLPIPIEAIHIIQDFAFANITTKTKKQKDFIIRMINKTIWNGRAQPQFQLDGFFVFCINNYKNDYSLHKRTPLIFGKIFCIKCGDYKKSEIDKGKKIHNNKILCNCEHNILEF